MDSRCLSAAGLRFLRHPIPTREFCVPCGSLTGHRSDSVGLTTFRNKRRCDWFRRPLCCVSIGYPQPSTGHLRVPAQTLGRQPLPKFSITQLQPRIHFRSPCQPFPSPDAPFGLGQSLGIFLVLPHPAVTGNACEEREQMGYSSVVSRRTPFLQHRVAHPGWSRTSDLLVVTQASSPLDHGISSDRGGRRTHKPRGSRPRRFANLRTRSWRVRGLRPAFQAYEARTSTGSPASCRPRYRTGQTGLMKASQAPAKTAMQLSSSQRESRTPTPAVGHDVLSVACLPIPPVGYLSSDADGNRTRVGEIESLAAKPSSHRATCSECAGTELNRQGP